MLESNEPNDLFVQRSKSYDARLNYVYDSPVYYNNNNNNNNNSNSNLNTNDETTKTNETSKQSDLASQTQIIVTSFAPDPKTKNLVRTTVQTRPVSQQFASTIKNEDTVQITTSTSNMKSNNSTPTQMHPSKKQQEELTQQDYKRKLNIVWQDGKNSPPLILFSAKVLRKTCWECKKIGEQFRMTYKFQNGEKKLVKAILDGHGFKEAHPNSSEVNLIWTGNNLKTYAFRSLQESQKVNHFPRSCELTRKDRLYKNVQRMQKEKGSKVFNILPITFIMPFEIDEFYSTFYREKGIWIVKPVSLSRGRGIYLISHPDQIPLEDNLVVSKYISNPLLIEGFKFDLRLYVAVTSFDPLVFYLYEEGLTRFATIKYDQNLRNIKNICMHLTNYSLNKKNDKYVRCNDPDVEDYGNKWTMSALLRYLSAQGKDTFGLMMHIEEAIIKTLLAVESPLASATRMFVPNRNNCFDEEMRPWVLEVNLSPSLDCDALLDVRVKSNMLADLFTLTGIYCTNPNNFSNRSRLRDKINPNKDLRVRPHSASLVTNNSKSNSNTTNNSNNINNSNTTTNNTATTSTTNTSANATTTTNNNTNNNTTTFYVNASATYSSNNTNNDSNTKAGDPLYDGLNPTEQEILKTVINEEARQENWVRLFPTSDTWEFYSQYLENRSTSYNMMIHKRLFGRRWQPGTTIKKATHSRARLLQNMYATYRDSFNLYNSPELTGASLNEALVRYKRYERKLNDAVKPCEETLKRLSSQPFHNLIPLEKPLPIPSNLKSNFNVFPNGDLRFKNMSISSNEEESQDNLEQTKTKLVYPHQANYYVKKQLPSLSSMIKRDKRRSEFSDEYDDEDSSRESDDDQQGSSNNGKPVEIKYDLETVLKHLENGYYISRIQVRNAFALYLFKIHVRLVTESQNKDDSNVQQMDLVLRFIRKAAPNLSQEFKVYVPSKRLPLSEQKRMLAKQLHDFLHIYRKDTGQIRIDMSSQLEQERKRFRNRLIEEKAFQALLYKCTESELEEIMSVYMKNSQDSTVFLGTCKNMPYDTTTTNEIINFNLTAPPQPQPLQSTSSHTSHLSAQLQSTNSTNNTEAIQTEMPTKPKSAMPASTQSQTNSPIDRFKSANPSKLTKALSNNDLRKLKRPETAKTTPYQSAKVDSATTTTSKTTTSNQQHHKRAVSGVVGAGDEEMSGLSCDSHSGFSNSSESEDDTPGKKQNRSHEDSRSLSRSTSVGSHHRIMIRKKKQREITKQQAATRAQKILMANPGAASSNNGSASSKTLDSGVRSLRLGERSKTFVSSSRKFDYETIITNIYLNNSNGVHKNPATNNISSNANANMSSANSTTNKLIKKATNQNNPAIRPISSNLNKNASASGLVLNENNSSSNTKSDIPLKRATNYQQLLGVNLSPNSMLNSPTSLKDSSSTSSKSVVIQKHESSAANTSKSAANADEATSITNGLKHLSLRKQERVYSASRSAFRLASSLNFNDFDESNNSNQDISTSNTKLIDHLERQKEQTNRLLQKSKAKHNELISMSLIPN